MKYNNTSFVVYRPISSLASLSKIYEYVVFKQLLAYMETNRLFYSDQYGFRPGHSTELASVRFVNDLIQQMDNFNIPTSILIDLSIKPLILWITRSCFPSCSIMVYQVSSNSFP